MPKKKVTQLQDQYVHARRDHLLDAAAGVFAKKGFHRATIKDVARAAGVADGTIYNYFDNKTALLLGILNRLNESDQRAHDLALAAEMDLREFLRAYLRQRLERMGSDTQVLRAILSEVLVTPKLRKLYREQIIEPTFALGEKQFQQLAQQGKISSADIPLLARALAALFLGLVTLRALDDTHLAQQWDALPDVLTELILDGIAPTQTTQRAPRPKRLP